MSEHQEQVALIQWAQMNEREYPALRMLHAIPNGGWRAKKTAVWLKAEGLRRGVPDLCLPVARGGFHGMYLEAKFGYNKPTEHQEWWLEELSKEGYDTVVCWSFEEARAAILAYLAQEGGEE